MLEHLGLGIALTMQDDFTPQANKAMKTMTQFENKAEDMSQKVQKSMYNLQNIMLAGFSLNTVGGDFERTGKAIISTFKNINKEIINVSSEYQTLSAQMLTAFKGNAEEAREAFDWVRKFAERTPYDVKGLASAFQRLKTSGIDMRKEFKTANGELKTMAEYIGDLASRNMSSSGGASGMAYALQEAWAGQYRSIINRFNLSSADIAGLKKYAGKDVDKFMEEFTKLADRMAPDAMKNLEGTWQQVVNNMAETWSNFVYDLGQQEVFSKMTSTLNKLQLELMDILGNEKTLKSISDILVSLWKPVDFLASKLAKAVRWIVNFTSEHPKLTKFLAISVAIGGALSVVSGIVMKLFGSFMILGASLASTYLNFKLIKGLNMAGEFDFMWRSASRAGRSFTVMGLTVAGIALAMQSNFMGIRDKAETAFKNVRNAWQKSDYVIKNGVLSLKKVGEEYDTLTQKFVKLRLFGMILKNTIFGAMDEKGGILYTKKEIDNLRRNGMLPLAQTFAILKGRARDFFTGLKDGIGSAFVVAKNFLDIVLAPIKSILDTVWGKLRTFSRSVKGIFGIQGDAGMDKGMAQEQGKMFEDVGKKAGILLGALLGLKIVKTISPVITLPFKLLTRSIQGSISAVGRLKDSMSNGLSRMGAPFSSARSTWNDRKSRAGERFNDFLNEYQDLPTYDRSYDGMRSSPYGYRKVKSAPERFSNFVVPQTYGEVDPNNIYTKKRSKLGERLFGNTYYTRDADGNMRSIGRWGGRFSADRDDKQLMYSQEKILGNGGTFRRPTLDDFGGDRTAYRRVMSRLPNLNPFIGTGASVLKGMESDSEFSARKQSTENKLWANRYKMMGVDGRSFNGNDVARLLFEEDFVKNVMPNTPEMQAIARDEQIRGMKLFADNRQSKLSQALFGKKIYSITDNADGTLGKRVVARTGGLFRSSSKDMVYNPEATLGERLRDSKLGQFGASMKDRVSGVVSGVGQGVSSTMSALGDTTVGKVLASPFNFISRQKQRLNIGEKDKSNIGLFSRLFAREEVDEDGIPVRKAGLFRRGADKLGGLFKGTGKLAKGVGKVGGGLLRGAGKVVGGAGKLAMGALPLLGGALSVGKLGFDLISQKGGGDFSVGLNMLKEDIKKIDLTEIWNKFKDTAKESFKVIKEIAITIFGELKESMPTILSEAWDGIKGMAGLAWDWIKEHGVTVISNFVDWVFQDGIPMLFKALLGIGKWIMTDFVPFLWNVIQQVVPKIIDGLKGIGKAIWDMMKGLVATLIRAVLPDSWESPVLRFLGLEKHHGGLFMSPNEHMAIIRKDETVLPPDISRRFNFVLDKLDHEVKDNTPTRDKAQAILDEVSRKVPKSSPNNVGSNTSINIDKVEIVVKADKLSRAEARQQAKYILQEITSMGKEELIRKYV